MARPHRLIGTVAGALLVLSAPLIAHADPRPLSSTTRPTPSDTAARSETSRRERVAPAPVRKKPAKARPSTTPSSGQYIQDQPWETEFFVDNYVPGSRRQSAPKVALTSLTRAP